MSGRVSRSLRPCAKIPAGLAVMLAALAVLPEAGRPATASGLTVVLAVPQPAVTQPFPARVTLRLHNAGAKPLWLYRHVRDPLDRARTAESGETPGPAATNGGSRLVVHLDREQAPKWSEPPRGAVLASVDMPHPHLVSLAPGADTTEGVVIALAPGLVTRADHPEPVWGHYRLSVSYQASYSNGDALSRDLGVDIWQGEAASNAVDVDLEPAPASASGGVGGKITNHDGRPLNGVLVSLSDHESHVLSQMITDVDGAFSFSHLPPGMYWVTARRIAATYETAVFEHASVQAGASAAVHLVILEPELYEGKQFWHKPVLLRVTNNAGEALEGVEIDALKTSGDVAETVKGETDANGAVSLDLIPGRSYLTLKRRRCQETSNRLDVAEGDGIDGETFQMDCK